MFVCLSVRQCVCLCVCLRDKWPHVCVMLRVTASSHTTSEVDLTRRQESTHPRMFGGVTRPVFESETKHPDHGVASTTHMGMPPRATPHRTPGNMPAAATTTAFSCLPGWDWTTVYDFCGLRKKDSDVGDVSKCKVSPCVLVT